MAIRQQYNSLDELRAAQERLAAKGKAIEADLQQGVTNPLGVVQNLIGGSKKEQSKTHSTIGAISDMLTSLGINNALLDLAVNTVLPLFVTNKISKSLLKNTAKWTLRFAIVNVGYIAVKKMLGTKKKKN